MSKNNDHYQPNPTPDYLVERGAPDRPGADMRLRLLTLKDLANAFLQELGALGQQQQGPTGNVENGVDFYDEVRRFEIELIQTALRHTNGVQTEAATLLGLKPTTLHAKLKQYQLSAAEFGARAPSSPAAGTAAQPRQPAADGRARDSYREPTGDNYREAARDSYREAGADSYREAADEEADERVPVLA